MNYKFKIVYSTGSDVPQEYKHTSANIISRKAKFRKHMKVHSQINFSDNAMNSNTTSKQENLDAYFTEHRKFIAMVDTNMYDSIYFNIHWLNSKGYSGINREIKIDGEFVQDQEERMLLANMLMGYGYNVKLLNAYIEALKFDEQGILECAVYFVFIENEMIVITRDTTQPPAEVQAMIDEYENRNIRIYEYNRPGDENLMSEKTELFYKDSKDFHPEFYPWLKEDFQTFIDGFLESNNNLLFIFGPPGTGKTSFLKQLILRQKNEVMISSNTQVIESGLLFSEFSSSDAKLLIMEDADKITGKREDGNAVMAQLLNSLSGITTRNDKKIIVSTNLPTLDKVDPALIRPGRCYKVLCFPMLSVDEANLAREAIGLMPVNFNKEKVTLAEALNFIDEQDLQSRSQKNAGFSFGFS